MIYFGAILMGMLGSLHCVGMCGPIALALPYGSNSASAKLTGISLYNLGRIFTYSLIGILFGALGKGFVMAGLQQFLSVTVGSVILLLILMPAKYKNSWSFFKFFVQWANKIKMVFSKNLQSHRKSSLFAIGVLNGMLPCGLVYLAMAGAVATGSVAGGAAFMAGFGLGTVPLMLTVSLTKDLFSVNIRKHLHKAVPYFVSAMAILLVLRGLNLGIPYVSPKLNENKTLNCCVDKHCKK
jgi:hypothetical protein